VAVRREVLGVLAQAVIAGVRELLGDLERASYGCLVLRAESEVHGLPGRARGCPVLACSQVASSVLDRCRGVHIELREQAGQPGQPSWTGWPGQRPRAGVSTGPW
jgi:hypothetical protein